MKHPVFFSILLLLLLIGSVNAIKINTTLVAEPENDPNISPGMNGEYTSVYSFSASQGNSIIFSSINPLSEGRTINFRFVRPSSTDITGSIRTESTGFFSGNLVTSIDGGGTSTQGYTKYLLFPEVPKISFFYVTDGVKYYFVETDSAIPQYILMDFIFNLDTEKDAYIEVISPVEAPIRQVIYSPLSTSKYSVESYYESFEDVKSAAVYANTTINRKTAEADNPWENIYELIDLIKSAILGLISFLQSLVSISTWMMIVVAFIFAGKFFLGCIAVYTIINAVWCMRRRWSDPVNEMIFAFKEFIHNEIALFEFFMRFVKWAKELIKWW